MAGEQPDEGEDTRDDRETPADPEAPESSAAVTVIGKVQDAIYYVIAVLLVGLAIAALVRIGIDFFTHDEELAQRVANGVNGVLFVVIVLELLRTILAHFDNVGFQLKPFLIIGIVSSVRHILTVGAELSLAEEDTSHLIHRADVELGVNAMVVLVLVLGLVLVRKSE